MTQTSKLTFLGQRELFLQTQLTRAQDENRELLDELRKTAPVTLGGFPGVNKVFDDTAEQQHDRVRDYTMPAYLTPQGNTQHL